MRTTRRVVAVSCIALVVFAAFLPLGGVALDWLVVTPAFTLLPPLPAPVLGPEALVCRGQSIALRAVLDSRGPPNSASAA